jgi:hypothetical protein
MGDIENEILAGVQDNDDEEGDRMGDITDP